MNELKLAILQFSFIAVCRVIDTLQSIGNRIYNKGAILEFNLEKARRKEVLSKEVEQLIQASMRQAKILEARKDK